MSEAPSRSTTQQRMSYEMGPIRPPNEGGDCSLLIRATRNCPWNRCLFCRTYQGQRFEYRSPGEVKGDIEVARSMADDLLVESHRLGLDGRIDNQALARVWQMRTQDDERDSEIGVRGPRYSNLINVANWLNSGAQTVFLQDGDTVVMRTQDLVDIIHHLKATFPSIQRVTSYARSQTLDRKTLEDLRLLRQTGLSRLHVGLESGCEEVLAYMQKGVTSQVQIAAGCKVVEAGISLSMYVMPGLGGRKWSRQHALETARVLNAINPHFVRLRTLVPRNGSALQAHALSGDFQLLSEDEVVGEIRLLIDNLATTSYLSSDQMCNLLGEVEGQLPYQKVEMLATIARYQGLSPAERLQFQLGRRARSYLAVFGGFGSEEEAVVRRANDAVQTGSPEMAEQVEAAISLLKREFI